MQRDKASRHRHSPVGPSRPSWPPTRSSVTHIMRRFVTLRRHRGAATRAEPSPSRRPGIADKRIGSTLNHPWILTGFVAWSIAGLSRAADDLPAAGLTQLETVIVTGKRDDYVPPASSSTATKTDTPLMETPVKVEVVTEQILQDQGVTSRGLADALTVFGIQNLGQGDLGEVMFYRGFSTNTTLWNGFRVEDIGTNTGPINGGVWMENVERIEIMRGPSSILYGRAEPGGAANVITKSPEGRSAAALEVGAGSFDDRWVSADLTGPINQDETLRYRVNLGFEGSDSWYRYGPDYESLGVGPALRWDVTPRTTLSVEAQFRKMDGSSTQPYIPVDTATQKLLPIDPSRTLMPGAQSEFHQSRAYASLEHRFDDDWEVAWRYLHNDARNPLTVYPWIVGMEYPGALSTLATATRGLVANRGDQQVDATMLDLTGHVATGAVRHTLLAGADYYATFTYQNQNFDCWCVQFDYLDPPPVPKEDIPGDYYDWNVTQHEISLYLQDQIALPFHWHLLAGGRYQRLKERSLFSTPPGTADEEAFREDIPYERNVFVPRAGLLWQPLDWLSVYYSYAENAGASQGLAYPGRPIEPERARQHEVGGKTVWLDGRLDAALALFDLTKTNIVAGDPAHPGFNQAVGEVQSRGVELHVQGSPTERWNVLASWNYARPLVSKGTDAACCATSLQPLDIVEGTLLPYFSDHAVTLLTSYRLPFAALPGWKIGGSYRWFSAANMDSNSAVETHPYDVASLFSSYETRTPRYTAIAQINVDNLFDEDYLTYQGDVGAVEELADVNFVGGNWGTPRQVRMSLRIEF